MPSLTWQTTNCICIIFHRAPGNRKISKEILQILYLSDYLLYHMLHSSIIMLSFSATIVSIYIIPFNFLHVSYNL